MTLKLDPYILDTLMPDLIGHDRHPAAFLVYLYLWNQTGKEKGRPVRRSLTEIAEGTGLSKRAVQTALARLDKRKLVASQRESITSVPEYEVLYPWPGGK